MYNNHLRYIIEVKYNTVDAVNLRHQICNYKSRRRLVIHYGGHFLEHLPINSRYGRGSNDKHSVGPSTPYRTNER